MTLQELNEMLVSLSELMDIGKPHRYLQLRMLDEGSIEIQVG
ncbi:MAG: hypothetical protein ACK6DI_07305 [Betaproteobacteria bacterium]